MQCPEKDLILRFANNDDIDAEQKEAVEKHLSECDECRKLYNSYVAMQRMVTDLWDGKKEGCPDTDTLSEYIEGWLDDDEDEKKKVEEHISHCKICAYDIESMKQMDASVELAQEKKVPENISQEILSGIMAKRSQVLLESMRADYKKAAKRLIDRFMEKYQIAEQSVIDLFWNMFSSSYNRDIRFGASGLDAAISGAAGDSEDSKTPSAMFTIMGICDYLQDLDGIPDEKQIRNIVRENTRRFRIGRKERRIFEEFIMDELGKD